MKTNMALLSSVRFCSVFIPTWENLLHLYHPLLLEHLEAPE
jgi:hypothetical protein